MEIFVAALRIAWESANLVRSAVRWLNSDAGPDELVKAYNQHLDLRLNRYHCGVMLNYAHMKTDKIARHSTTYVFSRTNRLIWIRDYVRDNCRKIWRIFKPTGH